MTETTAKKGMLKFKKGFNKTDFDYDYIENIPYNDTISVRNLIKGLQAEDMNIKLENKELKEKLQEALKHNSRLDQKIDSLELAIYEIKTQYYEALKGVITR
jgi:predicted nuclease with TOPRIM domain